MKKIIFTLILFSCISYSQENFWEQTNGPYSAHISVLAIDSNSNIFAGTNGGIYRSTTTGENWVEINNGLGTSHTVPSIVINSNGDLLAITRDKGLYKSTDKGDSWTLIYPVYLSSSLAINSRGYVYIGCQDSIVFSTNNGDDWNLILNQLPPNDQYDFEANKSIGKLIFNKENHIFASIGRIFVDEYIDENNQVHDDYFYENGIYKSINNGKTWSKIFNSDFINDFAINSLGHIFATSYEGVYRSTDNGENWIKISNVYSTKAVIVNSADEVFIGIASGIGGVYKSMDNGETWEQISSNNYSSLLQVSCLAINQQGYIFAGTYGWKCF